MITRIRNVGKGKSRFYAMLVVIIIIIVSGCSLIGPETGNGSQLKKHHEGTDGINIEFLKSNPKYTYEGESFGSALFVKNQGAEDVTAANPGKLSVSYDNYYLNLDDVNSDAQGEISSIVLAGKSDAYPIGDENYFEFLFYTKELGILADKIDTTIHFNLCYPYKTELLTETCIDTKIRTQETVPSACSLKTLTFTKGQGAPVSITKIVPDMVMKKDSVIPVFDITVKNNNDGYIINNVVSDVCSNENIAQNSAQLNKVSIKAKLSTDVELKCTPSDVKILNGEGTTRCVVPDDRLSDFPRNKRNYNTFLEVTLDYAYVYTTTQDIEIRRIDEIEPSSLPGCGYYEKYDEAQDKCISLCEFCVKNPDSQDCTRNRDESFKFDSSFSCSCTKDKCLTLSKDEKCIFGYCAGSTYCCSNDECAGKIDNTTCGDHYVCRDQKCGPTTICDMQLGAQNYSCRNIDQCNQTTIKTLKCPYGTDNVCCQLPK